MSFSFNVRNIIYKKICKNNDFTLFLKSIESRKNNLSKITSFEWFTDRIFFCLKVILRPLIQITKGFEFLKTEIIVYDPSSNVAETRNYRKIFIKHYFKENVDFIGWKEKIKITPNILLWPTLKLYIYSVFISLFSFLDFSKRDYKWLGSVFPELLNILLIQKDIKKIYIFCMEVPAQYLYATYINNYTKIQIYLINANIPIKEQRYCHLNVPAVLCSKVQLNEINYYINNGYNKTSKIIYCSNVFIADLLNVRPTAPKYHIGYFSSGEWARINGLFRVKLSKREIKKVREMHFNNNLYYIKSKEILSFLVRFGKIHNLRLKIYLHPYERLLLKKYKISPPYMNFVDNENIFIDIEGNNSRDKIYEPFVAISIQSSFIWERLDLGLMRSYIYEFKDEKYNSFLPESLGNYKEYLFKSTEELAGKMKRDLIITGGVIKKSIN